MRTLAKVLRIAGKIAVGVLAAVVLLVAIAWTFLQTRQGGELVRRIALPRVNAALAGTIAVERFTFGGDRVTLENVALTDPDGQFVGRVARVDVWFSPRALLRRHVDLRAVEIRRPELALVQDARGLNLARALAPPHPEAAGPAPADGPAGGGSRIAIDVRALAVTGGVIDYRSLSGGPHGPGGARGQETHVNVADLSIHGAARLDGDRVSADAAIRVRGGQADARGTFDLRTRRGEATVRAGVRGVGLAADGRLDGDRIAGRARVDATDLAVTARALARDFGLERMPISGHGRLDVECGGTTAKPSLRVSARFPTLGFDDKRAKELEASARIPDLGAPDALDLDVRASSVWLGAQQLRSPAVTARTAGRRVTAHVAIAAPQPLTIDLGGTRAPGDRQTLAVDALEIRYPEATWTLRRRARLSLAGGLALTGFELQRRRAARRDRSARRRPGADRARRRVPTGSRAAAARAGIAGVGSRRCRRRRRRRAGPSGAGARPRVVATAKLAGGRIRGHRDLSLDLQARVERGRASGAFNARAPGIAATARFDLPGEWPPRNARAPIALDVDVTDADLAAVAKTLADAQGVKAARVAGQARASIKVEGRVGEPRVHVDVSGRGLAFGDRRVGDLAVSVSGEGDGQLTARLTSTAPIPVRIDLTTALSVTSVLRHPPTAEALARTPFEIKGTVDRLPLADIARAAGYPARVGGTLSAQLSVTGTPSEPRGTVAADIAGATAQRFPPTDARIELDFDR